MIANAPNEKPLDPAPPPKAGVDDAFCDPKRPPPAPPGVEVLAAPKAGVAFAVLPKPPVERGGTTIDVEG